MHVLYIYICMYTYICMYCIPTVHVRVIPITSLSLSLSIYIYIYACMYTDRTPHPITTQRLHHRPPRGPRNLFHREHSGLYCLCIITQLLLHHRRPLSISVLLCVHHHTAPPSSSSSSSSPSLPLSLALFVHHHTAPPSSSSSIYIYIERDRHLAHVLFNTRTRAPSQPTGQRPCRAAPRHPRRHLLRKRRRPRRLPRRRLPRRRLPRGGLLNDGRQPPPAAAEARMA
jgi:hypothetical protein